MSWKMIENVFRKKYAECLIARKETSDGSKGEAVGLALVSHSCFLSSFSFDIRDRGALSTISSCSPSYTNHPSTSSLIRRGSAFRAST
jgi:hypothetical protein